MMKIIIDGKEKADLPTENCKHKQFNAVLQMFLFSDWKETFTIKKEEQ